MLSSAGKGMILGAAAGSLLAIGAVTTNLNAAEPVMVKCVGIKDKNACPNGCPNKNPDGPKWSLMTKEACIKAGGRPVKIKK